MSTTSSCCASDSLAEPGMYLRHSFTPISDMLVDEEIANDREDSAYSSDDTDGSNKFYTPPQSQARRTWTRPLQTLDPNEGKFDLSDDEDDEPSPHLIEESVHSGDQSIFSSSVAHYELLLGAHAPFAHMARAERALITHLRTAPVTLADVHALLHAAQSIMPSDLARTPPTLLMEKRTIKAWFDDANVGCNRNVMSALAGNIGYFAAWDVIGGAEVEDMLMHIVSLDPALFDLVKWNIGVETWVRRFGVVPCGEMVPCRQQAVLNEGKAFAPKPARRKKKRRGKQFSTLRAVWEEEMCGWFTVTRLHNGPGLMDRIPPVVKLPVHMGDKGGKRKRKRKQRVKVGAAGPRTGLEMRTLIPFEFGGGAEVRVRLPQRPTSSGTCT